MWRYISIYKIWIHCPAILAILLLCKARTDHCHLFFFYLILKWPLLFFSLKQITLNSHCTDLRCHCCSSVISPHLSKVNNDPAQYLVWNHTFILYLDSRNFKFFVRLVNIWIFNSLFNNNHTLSRQVLWTARKVFKVSEMIMFVEFCLSWCLLSPTLSRSSWNSSQALLIFCKVWLLALLYPWGKHILIL